MVKVVDQYGKKLRNSGYSIDQTRKILVSGIRGYVSKVVRSQKEGKNLRRTATESRWSRVRKKLTSKTSWYKKQKQQDHYKDDDHSSGKKRRQERSTTMESKTVLFIEYSKDGELAKQLRELMARLAPVIGFELR